MIEIISVRVPEDIDNPSYDCKGLMSTGKTEKPNNNLVGYLADAIDKIKASEGSSGGMRITAVRN